MAKLKKFNEYILMWQKKFNKKFPYKIFSCELINAKKPIPFYCERHGWFWMSINNLLKGEKCKFCKKVKKSIQHRKEYGKKFIEMAKVIHNNFYDYSKVSYVKNSIDVRIICPIHGEFLQTPNNHLQGKGCQICALEKNGFRKRLSQEEALEKAKMSHNGENYLFDRFIYNGRHSKCVITCPIHSDFSIEYGAFIGGEGCPICGRDKAHISRRNKSYDVLKRCKDNNPKGYYFDNFIYHGMDKKSLFTCKKHGDFPCTPAHFIAGSGCPKCNNSKMENELSQYFDDNRIYYIQQYIIGCDKRYKYDFYLPNNNIIIECQGEQHFYPVDFSHKNKDKDELSDIFDKQIDRDIKKYNLAINNGYRIIYYINRNFFKDRKLVINNEFYYDKEIIDDKEQLLLMVKL